MIKEAVICVDGTKSFRYSAQARDAFAQWIKASAHPGDVYYFRWIENNSYRPEAEVVPALHVTPQPTSAPLPAAPPQPNPFSTAQVSQATATVVAIQTLASRAAATQEKSTRAARETLDQQLQAFVEATTEPTEAGDLSGCVKKALELLAGFDGDRYLFVASASNEGAPQVPGLKLDRVQVRVVYLQCDQPEECDDVKQQWASVSAASNAAELGFSDPSEGLSRIEQ